MSLQLYLSLISLSLISDVQFNSNLCRLGYGQHTHMHTQSMGYCAIVCMSKRTLSCANHSKMHLESCLFCYFCKLFFSSQICCRLGKRLDMRHRKMLIGSFIDDGQHHLAQHILSHNHWIVRTLYDLCMVRSLIASTRIGQARLIFTIFNAICHLLPYFIYITEQQ